MSEIEDLISLVQGADAHLHDDVLGRVICSLLGVEFMGSTLSMGDDGRDEYHVYSTEKDAYGKTGNEVWSDYRHLAPDCSVDAVLNLRERAFPGWLWKMGSCCVSDDAWVCPDFNCPTHGQRLHAQFGEYEQGSPLDMGFDVDRRPPVGKPCLAMLEAMLMARAFVLSRALQSDNQGR